MAKSKLKADGSDPDCEVHKYLMPDGHCTCRTKCHDCGTVYIGHNHDAKRCIASLRKQLEGIKNSPEVSPMGNSKKRRMMCPFHACDRKTPGVVWLWGMVTHQHRVKVCRTHEQVYRDYG